MACRFHLVLPLVVRTENCLWPQPQLLIPNWKKSDGLCNVFFLQ